MTQPTTTITTPLALNRTRQAKLTSPWFVQKSEFHALPASYRPLVNGKEAFGAVYDAIAAAQRTVDIVCWGFQPSMYFKRDGGGSLCIGDLLVKKGLEGVQIRILCWADPVPFSQTSENGTPGLTPLRSLFFQNENNTEREYDREWYRRATQFSPGEQELAKKIVAKSNGSSAHSRPVGASAQNQGQLLNIQLITRDFSFADRCEIVYRETMRRADKGLGEKAVLGGFGGLPTHHQKMVLIDYEDPEKAVGFVMGHNTLDAYWDDDAHSYARMNARFGRNGATPRQDMSAVVTGPILEHLNVNFCNAWKHSTEIDLLATRKAVAGHRLLTNYGTPVMAQILRTQSQEGRRDIRTLYQQAVKNTANFVYIENQYFRWPPLADALKANAAAQADAGRKSPLYLFVVTNSNDEGLSHGEMATYRMLDSLGRAEVMPGVTRLELEDQRNGLTSRMRQDQYMADYGDPTQRAQAAADAKAVAQKMEEIDHRIAELSDKTKQPLPQNVKGLKVHVCTLVAPDSPPDAWMYVYIHSKIMVVDDIFLTNGSANLNTRSMEVDSELNICHENAEVTHALRKRLWGIHTRPSPSVLREAGKKVNKFYARAVGDDMFAAFGAWGQIIEMNKNLRRTGKEQPIASLVGFMTDTTERKATD